ncbi:MAG: hypothetical protein FWG23_00210 [Eggerthellaceae bacterium]|jgi:hypothetical protein|nr:hypothetical protein [Eggerthellaceae bacterium]MDR2715264.1 hypothetical protein [Coriobacteriaceae bacterium]
MSPHEITRGGKDYIGYDYKTAAVEGGKASLYLDAYENFGWMPDGAVQERPLGGTVVLKLKRDRKILNKAELTRLQQHFEACMDEIAALEHSKTQRATAVSLAIGLGGTAFLAGSVFAVTNEPPLVLLCALLGIPGLIGWAVPYSLFKLLVGKRTAEVSPLIEAKYDEIHEICAKGKALAH